MNRSAWDGRVTGVAFSLLGVVAVAGFGVWALTSNHLDQSPHAPGAVAPAQLPPGSYPAFPLAAGTVTPAFEAAGWLNGTPPQPGGQGPRLIVLDVWAHW